MGTILNKLWDSKSTIIIVLWVVVFAWVYTLDYPNKPVTHTTPPTTKTLEEIMAATVDNPPEPALDTDFKSAVEPM